MKNKHIFIILAIMVVLLLYNLFCYALVNRNIEIGSKNLIQNYFQTVSPNNYTKYEYLMATNNDDGSINIFVKTKNNSSNEYYRFIVARNGALYSLKDVNRNVPAYVKKYQ